MFQKFIQPVPGRFKTPITSGQLLLWFLRVCYGAIIISLSMVAFSSVGEAYHSTFLAYAAFLGVLCAGLFLVLTDVWLTNKQITTISALYFGLLLGLLLGNILSLALDPFLFDVNVNTELPQIHMLQQRPGTPYHGRLLLHLHFHPLADQGRIPLYHSLCGILQADQRHTAACP